VLSAVGLIHAYQWTFGDAALALKPAWEHAIGYAAMAALLFVAPWITERDEAGHGAQGA